MLAAPNTLVAAPIPTDREAPARGPAAVTSHDAAGTRRARLAAALDGFDRELENALRKAERTSRELLEACAQEGGE